jgi:transposase-like protein
MMKPTQSTISKGGSYPPEFREEAMRYWMSSGHTLVAVASDRGLSPQCLVDWRRQMESIDSPPSDPTIKPKSTGELALARELGVL